MTKYSDFYASGTPPDIFPINFLVKSKALYFRRAPGTKILALSKRREVAVEIDGTEGGKRFSVVMRGQVSRLNDDVTIQESGLTTLHTMTSSEKWNYFMVTPETVTGVRFQSRRRPAEHEPAFGQGS
ncbi:pyridoxamine 5'-phosphate oxidase family protein [Subtercola boreus]|nr:pyridoxamine 5'-phosphate oxidase family protein [Subtercola boreus]